jgi:hypothetical protein
MCKFISLTYNFHLQLFMFHVFNLNLASFWDCWKQDASCYYHHNISLVFGFFVVGVFHGHCYSFHFHIWYTFYILPCGNSAFVKLCKLCIMCLWLNCLEHAFCQIFIILGHDFTSLALLFTIFVRFPFLMDLIIHYNVHYE